MIVYSNLKSCALAAALGLAVAACGGGDDPEDALRVVNSVVYAQSAPSGSITIGAGETKAERAVVSVTHHNTNERPARVTVAAEAKKVEAIGPATKAGLRWEIRVSGLVVAQGDIPAGNGGKAAYDIDIERGATVVATIYAFVEARGGAAAGVSWESASIDATVK